MKNKKAKKSLLLPIQPPSTHQIRKMSSLIDETTPVPTPGSRKVRASASKRSKRPLPEPEEEDEDVVAAPTTAPADEAVSEAGDLSDREDDLEDDASASSSSPSSSDGSAKKTRARSSTKPKVNIVKEMQNARTKHLFSKKKFAKYFKRCLVLVTCSGYVALTEKSCGKKASEIETWADTIRFKSGVDDRIDDIVEGLLDDWLSTYVRGDRLTPEIVQLLHSTISRHWGISNEDLDKIFEQTIDEGLEFGLSNAEQQAVKAEVAAGKKVKARVLPAFSSPISTDVTSGSRLRFAIIRAGKRVATSEAKIALRRLIAHFICALAVFVAGDLDVSGAHTVQDINLYDALSVMFPGGTPYIAKLDVLYVTAEARAATAERKRAAKESNAVGNEPAAATAAE
jgi:hypothetical protein